MRILALETSCDETAAAVVADGHRVLSSVVASQMELHARFGGIYPEVASRQHVLAIDGVIATALREADITAVADLDLIAVTHGPGLVGSLMVGVNAAKGLSLASAVPLVGVNHLVGHIYSLWLDDDSAVGCSWRDLAFPIVFLIVSGGHTELVLMEAHGQFQVLGSTLDDAAGEAFDKVARLLGLGFPGGPVVEQAARQGDPRQHDLPNPLQGDRSHRFDFSFSGLKTDMLHRARKAGLPASGDPPTGTERNVADLAAAFQARVVTSLLDKTVDAVQTHEARSVCICGGVSANQRLRQEATERFGPLQVPLRIPPLKYCTDNAAMIAAAAHALVRLEAASPAGLDRSGLAMDVFARLPIPTGPQA